MVKKKIEVIESAEDSSSEKLENSETSETKTNTIFNQGCRRHRLRFQG